MQENFHFNHFPLSIVYKILGQRRPRIADYIGKERTPITNIAFREWHGTITIFLNMEKTSH